ncbi:NAD(P)-dependent oxidoreductase [Adhaeribacter pallidiroseus]|uniref:NAD(P)-binding domain-containing protein n=1 Tax=Adhaeribacter pallidiroseus TaxID=2072847 RepID=A0A369QTW3_9BACT|nr:SDR family oxidoreductase [Adhaeribacter pallidiroseus]RDC66249.1 hypothetical protein AHMF7616_04880 [Adhaeribacter pallidiroseus]
MKILILGASGATGRHLVRQALEQKHQVTAFLRNPAKLKVSHRALTLEQGNVSDLVSVQRAIAGQEVVVSALGADHMFQLDQALLDGMANIIKAMQSSNVRRLVYLSTLGVSESRNDAGFIIRNLAPTLLRTEIKGHEVREKMICESDLEWQIVRAPILTNGPLTRKYRSGENLKSNRFAPALSRADIADFMLSLLTDMRYLRQPVRLMPALK